MERIVTVSGDAVNEPGNFKVPFGISHEELVEAAGGFKSERKTDLGVDDGICNGSA